MIVWESRIVGNSLTLINLAEVKTTVFDRSAEPLHRTDQADCAVCSSVRGGRTTNCSGLTVRRNRLTLTIKQTVVRRKASGSAIRRKCSGGHGNASSTSHRLCDCGRNCVRGTQ